MFDLLCCFLLQLDALIICLHRFCQLYKGGFKLPQKKSREDVREYLRSELAEENRNSFGPALPRNLSALKEKGPSAAAVTQTTVMRTRRANRELEGSVPSRIDKCLQTSE